MQHTSNENFTPLDAFRHIQNRFKWDQEEVHIIALNSRYQILRSELLFRGTVDACLFHPRDVFRFAIQHNASAFFLVHNHPSGNSDPSNSDIVLTKKLLHLSRIMEIEFIDHLIFTKNPYTSMRELKFFDLSRPRR